MRTVFWGRPRFFRRRLCRFRRCFSLSSRLFFVVRIFLYLRNCFSLFVFPFAFTSVFRCPRIDRRLRRGILPADFSAFCPACACRRFCVACATCIFVVPVFSCPVRACCGLCAACAARFFFVRGRFPPRKFLAGSNGCGSGMSRYNLLNHNKKREGLQKLLSFLIS